MMTRRGLAGLAVGGAVALAGLGAARLGTFTAPPAENVAASIAERVPTPPAQAVATTAAPAPVIVVASADANLPASIFVVAAVAGAAAAPAVEPVAPTPPPTPGMQLASVPTSGTVDDELKQPARPITPESIFAAAGAAAAEAPAATDPAPTPPPARGMQLASVPSSGAVDDEMKQPAQPIAPAESCVTDACIDAYLWSLYERASKIDTEKVPEQRKVTVKKKGKTRTVTRTIMTYVVADFTWKDPAAAQRAGMSVKDYVIGGMDPGFRRELYRALRMMDDAGLMPGITSAFRDDYRQSIATGNKASNDSSYHGGSRRGGYGHGLAADIVSVKGDTRLERFAASEQMWAWIDAHEKELGVGRPYLDRDPPHVAPLEGTEYRVKRSLAHLQRRAAQAKQTKQTKKTDKPRSKATKQLSRAADPARLGTEAEHRTS